MFVCISVVQMAYGCYVWVAVRELGCERFILPDRPLTRVDILCAFFSSTLASSTIRLVPALLLRSAADPSGGDHVSLARLR